ncbi:uncharacterized protein LOC116250410 [Nymphaea colorata]|uniref:Uncharacterized protein n=1 Tax=Nymphaea colorata TaxID=210225 RepID=A0A5K1BXW7_9MAGN|nr:uncharacterized protein LOC116250410 [Nymphaea colorata]
MVARCLKAMSPMRILCKARDLYVNAMLDCAGSMNWDAVGGTAASNMTYLPRSSSLGSSRSGGDDEDLKELVRAVSQKHLDDKLGERHPFCGRNAGARNTPGNFSLRIERIDEDKPCYFNEDHGLMASKVMFPRSKSYDMHRRRVSV